MGLPPTCRSCKFFNQRPIFILRCFGMSPDVYRLLNTIQASNGSNSRIYQHSYWSRFLSRTMTASISDMLLRGTFHKQDVLRFEFYYRQAKCEWQRDAKWWYCACSLALSSNGWKAPSTSNQFHVPVFEDWWQPPVSSSHVCKKTWLALTMVSDMVRLTFVKHAFHQLKSFSSFWNSTIIFLKFNYYLHYSCNLNVFLFLNLNHSLFLFLNLNLFLFSRTNPQDCPSTPPYFLPRKQSIPPLLLRIQTFTSSFVQSSLLIFPFHSYYCKNRWFSTISDGVWAFFFSCSSISFVVEPCSFLLAFVAAVVDNLTWNVRRPHVPKHPAES